MCEDLFNQNHVDIYNKSIKDLPFLESFYKVIEDKDKYDFVAKLINDLKEIKMKGTVEKLDSTVLIVIPTGIWNLVSCKCRECGVGRRHNGFWRNRLNKKIEESGQN